MSKSSWTNLFFLSQDAFEEARQDHAIQQSQITANSAMDTLVRMQQENAALRRRIERQDLLIQTLLRWHIDQGHFDAETFGVLISRADLADGYEDGGLGPDRSLAAPKCGACGRPVNPKRSQCVFCSAEMQVRGDREPPARTVTCGGCSRKVPENATYYGEGGLLCEPCFAQDGG